MTLRIDTLAYNNRLRSLATEQKLIFAIAVWLLALLGHLPVQLAIILWMAVWIVQYARIPIKTYLLLVGIASFFLFASLPAFLIQISPNTNIFATSPSWATWQIGSWYLGITPKSLQQTVDVVGRSSACTSCLFFLLCTVPFTRLLQVLRRCHCPAIVTELLLLMYRFIFLLLETAAQLHLAQKARGGYRTRQRTFKSVSLLAGQLLARTLGRYRQFQYSIAARGFSGEFRVYSPETTAYSWRYALESIVGCCGLLALEAWYLLK
jgi:cobalt/nickel transport system permease protein